MDILAGIGIFIAVLLLIEGSYAVTRTLMNPERRRVRRRLGTLADTGFKSEEEVPGIERQRWLSEIPWLHRILMKFQWSVPLNLLLQQAGIRYPVGFFLLLSLVLVGVGFLLGSWLRVPYVIRLPGLLLLGAVPFLYIHSKKRRRMQKFQAQLPEAMDLMARALKAGHAFSGGLKMVIDEMEDPVGEEFNKTMGEINFGVDVPQALKNLARRVDCADLRFFVISVILQRETGGNLAEILENIAYLIRERDKLHGRIRVLSAEGKLSAIVLISIPLLVALVLSLLNPKYIQVLVSDPLGNILVGIAVALMILGVAVMRRMIQIKV